MEIEKVENSRIPSSVERRRHNLVRKHLDDAIEPGSPCNFDLLAWTKIRLRIGIAPGMRADADQASPGFERGMNGGQCCVRDGRIAAHERNDALRENVCKGSARLRPNVRGRINELGPHATCLDGSNESRRDIRCGNVETSMLKDFGQVSGCGANLENGPRPEMAFDGTEEIFIADAMSGAYPRPVLDGLFREIVGLRRLGHVSAVDRNSCWRRDAMM